MKNVLYITYDGLTDPLGQSQILPYLEQLSKSGYRFTILSFEKKARYQKEASVIQAIVERSGIDWVPLFFTAKPPVLSKIWDRFRMQQKALALHRKKGFSLVHCRSYVAAEIGLLLKQKFGIKMLFDMRGFWADEKVDNGQWNLNKPLYKRIYQYYKKKEKEFLLGADGIVSLTAAAKIHLLEQPPYQHLSIDVIPCCADLQHFDYKGMNEKAVDELKGNLNILDGDKIITYLGSVGGWYMTKEMFRFFYLLLQKDPSYKMLLLTKDDPQQVQKEAAEARIPSHKLIITYSTRQQLPVFLSLSTCSLFFIRNTFSKMASSPTKHAELMGMGIPVVCNAIGDTGKVIQSTGTGILINDFDDASINAAVQQIEGLAGLDKAYIRNCALELFDLQAGSNKYETIYQTILNPVKRPLSTLHA